MRQARIFGVWKHDFASSERAFRRLDPLQRIVDRCGHRFGDVGSHRARIAVTRRGQCLTKELHSLVMAGADTLVDVVPGLLVGGNVARNRGS